MRRLLIVAYYFPPIGGIGSIRLSRFATLLPEFGWEPTVLAPRNTPHAHDASVFFREDRVVRAASVEFSRMGKAVPRREAGAEGTVNLPYRALRNAAHQILLYPDPQIGWYPGAVVAGRRALRSGAFDAVYSSSFPITAHLIARTLSRGAGLPWVAEFRDPWSDGLTRGRPHRRRARALEAAIAREAARVVMPTPSWASRYGSRWNTDIAVIPNGYDSERPQATRPDVPTLTHLGSFYPGRQDLTPVWRALQELVEDGHSVVPRVRFIGELDPGVRSDAAGYGVEHLIEVTGLIPHHDAMRLVACSSVLFASGAPAADPLARGWIPAKLFEYLATGLPILFIGDPTSDAARMLSAQPGCYSLEPTDVRGVRAAILTGLSGPTIERDVKHLSRHAGARKLADTLDDAVLARADLKRSLRSKGLEPSVRE